MTKAKAILLMAGAGERFGHDLPKQFHLLGNKKVYKWALDTLAESNLFEEIVLVCPFEYLDLVKRETKDIFTVIEGGKTRQDSSYLGLLALDATTNIVLIHDAVRPFVSYKILKENIHAAKLYDAVDTCISSPDTIVHSQDGKRVTQIPKRSEYLLGQTPQTFFYPLILEAHKRTSQRASTDDCTLVLEMGKNVHIVEGEWQNFKITTKENLQFANWLKGKETEA